jgi:DNA-directed RNA polymerase specialized sigma24 family protein
MAFSSGDTPPPSTDLEGWRQAIAEGRLPNLRLESIAAAFQDLGESDQRVREQLAQHLSQAVIKMLRKRVDPRKPNGGDDIIYQAHDAIIVALLNPSSADGKQLRKGFGGIVKFRLKDALAQSSHDQIVPAPKPKKSASTLAPPEKRTAQEIEKENNEAIDVAFKLLDVDPHEKQPEKAEEKIDEEKPGEEKTPAKTAREDGRPPPYIPDEAEDDEIGPGKQSFDPTLMDCVRGMHEQIDAARIVEKIPNHLKQLAFSLHMDGEKQATIAEACNVSVRTIRTWLAETKDDLKQTKEVQELVKMKARAKP